MATRNKNINIPNALSVLRILLIIPFVIFFMRDQIWLAVLMMVLSGLSDMLDGKIARRFNQFTELGKMLDPLADKLTQATIVVCFAIKQPALIPLLSVFLIKEILMLIAAGILNQKKKLPSAARWYGKTATVLFYLTFTIMVMLKGIWGIQNFLVDVVLLSITLFFMLYAFIEYAKEFFRVLRSTDPKDSMDLKQDLKGKEKSSKEKK